MEQKQKIRLLQSYTDLEKSILELEEKYEELFALSTKITPSYSESTGGGGFDNSKIEKNCIKLYELEAKKQKLIEKKTSIDDNLKTLTYMQRKVINYTCIENHSLYQASRYFKRSYNDIKGIYTRAITKIAL